MYFARRKARGIQKVLLNLCATLAREICIKISWGLPTFLRTPSLSPWMSNEHATFCLSSSSPVTQDTSDHRRVAVNSVCRAEKERGINRWMGGTSIVSKRQTSNMELWYHTNLNLNLFLHTKITIIYSLMQRKCPLFVFPSFLLPITLGQPMHSWLALPWGNFPYQT